MNSASSSVLSVYSVVLFLHVFFSMSLREVIGEECFVNI
jgi:hypothetical protein